MQTGGPVPEEPQSKPPKVVDLEEELRSDPKAPEGHSFFFGDIGLLKFADGTSYHIRKNRDTISDPKLIDNLLEAAKNPSLKIFLD